MSATPDLIGVDWGTSNLRIMRIGAGGAILGRRSDPRGASRLAPNEFDGIMREVAGDWVLGSVPILVCGMAGARGKWRETAYVGCPAGLAELMPVRLRDDGPAISIVPGASLSREATLTDVMRGEETQAMGLPDRAFSGTVVTPGTHSKWIRVERDRIKGFRSFMTGELFAAIRSGTILGQGMGEPGVDTSAFEKGVRRAISDHALTAILFSVRTERLSDHLAATSTADYLSGLLIGAEIAAQEARFDEPIMLIGDPVLSTRYAAALAMAGFSNVQPLDSAAATARGLWRIYEAHNA